MLDRSPFGWLRERDIDLLVCAELHHQGPLRTLFESRLTCKQATFEGAWVSHAEREGESDLVIAWRAGNESILALVENKIAAAYQPDQSQRYCQRADRWKRQPGVMSCTTVLFAPAEYLGRPGSEIFDHRLSYDEAVECLRDSADLRSKFLANALEEGIASYRRGYVAIPDETVTSVWSVIWNAANTVTPLLRFSRPGEKPSRSQWIYFREAAGMKDWREAVLVWKAERAQADLQFRGRSTGELEQRARRFLDPDMEIVKASKSASIRLNTPKIDFGKAADSQMLEIQAGLLACERLRGFLVANEAELLAR